MDVSVATRFDELPKESDLPESDLLAPREVVQEVAASLKALSKVLPYSEYASIVHRIAQLRWRCDVSRHGNTAPVRSQDEASAAER